MARPKNTEERRTQIVEGLLRAMGEHGYDGASVPRIAEAAGLAPGLVHYHFASKLDILLALIELLRERVMARFERRSAAANSARARLYAFLDAHVALGKDADPNAVACWVAIGAESLRQEAVQRAYKRVARHTLERLEQLVCATLRDEGRDPGAAAEIAAGLLSAVYGCYQLAIAAHAAPQGFAAPTLRRMADGLLAAQPESCT